MYTSRLCGALLATALIVLLAIGTSCSSSGKAGGNGAATPTSASPESTAAPVTTAAPEESKTPERTVNTETAFKLTPKTANNCVALAPQDWSIVAGPASDTADMLNKGGSMYAGWGIKPVNTTLAGLASNYPAPLNDPELYSADPATTVKAYASIVINSPAGFTDRDPSGFTYTGEYNQKIGDYTMRSMESDRYKGVALFRTEGFPGDGQYISYLEPMHLAITKKPLWDKYGMLVAKVAASIRCTTQLQQVAGGGVDEDFSGGSSSRDNGDEDAGSSDGYNPQLGTEYVHDGSTGENYLVSPSENWSDSGPGGPGYYKENGNGYTKLDPGRSD